MASSLSESLNSEGMNPMLTDLDGASVQSPAPVNSSEPSTRDMLLAALFDIQPGDGDPDHPASYEIFNGESASVWAEGLVPDCQPLNSAVACDVPLEEWLPEDHLDDSWLHDDKPTKDELYVSDSKVAPSIIGAGLANLGNTCFLNSILQCFTHTVPLVEGLLSCNHSFDGHNGYCVICAFRYQMQQSLQSTGTVISPEILVDNLKHFSSMFRRHQQEDAHEFMQCALDKLDSCFLSLKKNDPSFEGENIVNKVFGGSLVSKLRCCTCGRSSDTNEPLIDLSLEIENVDSLSSALESFTMVENIDEKLKCESCNEEVSMEKQLMLNQTPSIAALHLKRFKTDGFFVEKIDKHIDFPLELDLRPYTILNEKNNVPLKYDLYAVVVHIGFSSDSGHYFCFVRTAPDTWHKLDDSKVTKVSEKTVLSQEAYILFYARQDTPWFSEFAESTIPSLDLGRMNTSPKSVLDIPEGQDKSFPILNENVEMNKAEDSKKISEKKFDYSSRQSREKLKIDDVIDASPNREQLPAGPSNQKALNVKGLEDINSKVLPLDSACLTGTAKAGGSSYADNNKSGHSVMDFIDNNIFNSLTPPNTPPSQTSGKSFQISREHVKTEKQGSSSSKKSSSNKSNKLSDSPGKKAAITYLKKMRGSRRGAFMDLVNASHNKTSPENKRKNTDSSASDKGSARKKSGHASVGGYPLAIGISQ
ncbi:unnamed protein product [Lathyrus sativus]|nr:unnamed protein product [Lathyrus sativus]